MTRSIRRLALPLALAGLLGGAATPSARQAPAFSLASSHIFTSRERPFIHLSFRRVDHLDFRVYRVEDPARFFAGLKEPHVVGGPEPFVPMERSFVERIADWKALARLYDEYPDAVPGLKAYLVWVLARADAAGLDLTMGGRPPFDFATATDALWSARNRMTAYGRALLLSILDARTDARGDRLAADVVADARTRGELAWWPVEHDPLLGDFADTSVEATAMMVRALVARDPATPIVERAVRWLVASRTGGYWWNTKQTAMALYGLLDYMRARREQPSRYTVDVFVNGEAAGSHTFTPESWTAPDPVVVSAPGREGANEIRLVRRGDGPVYWAATAAYFDNREAIAPEGSRRLALAREYFALQPVERDGRIVYRETPFAGRARPGDLLLVRLTAAGSGDWRFLMIEDPLPAGAEAVRQDDLYELERHPQGRTYSRREYRDDRVVVFQQAFTEGRYEYTYLLKVVTPGVFRAMPPRIAPMYVPDATASGRAQPVTVSVAAAGAGGAR